MVCLFHLPYHLTVEGCATAHLRLDAWVVAVAEVAGLNCGGFVPWHVGQASYQGC